MGMKRIFQKAAMIGIKVAGDIAKKAIYSETTDDGFGEVTTVEKPITILYDKFTQEEGSKYTFSNLIQVTDKKGLVPSLSLSIPIKAQAKIISPEGDTFTIVAKDLDAAEAMFILLLRKA